MQHPKKSKKFYEENKSKSVKEFEKLFDDFKDNKLSEIPLENLIDCAESFVREKLRQVKTPQIRRFFDAIKNIKNSVYDNNGELTGPDKAKLLMLRPQLANASAKKFELKDLTAICTKMIKKVDDKDDFYHFANFFESLVAFHKAYADEK